MLALALLALSGRAAGVREVAASVLEPRRGAGQVAVRGDLLLRSGERLAQAVQRGLRALGVALGQALGCVAKGRSLPRRWPARRSPASRRAGAPSSAFSASSCSSSLSPRSLRSSCAFFGSPSLLASGLPVAARDRARLSEVSDAARCSLAGSIWARTSLSTAPEASQVDIEVAGLVAQLPGEVTQLLGEPGPWVLGVRALRVELLGELVEALRLPLGGRLHLALLGDDRVLRVRDEQDRDQQQAAATSATAGRCESRGLNRSGGAARSGRERVGALAADEAVGLGRVSGPTHRLGRLGDPPSGPADAGNAAASSMALETRSPRRPSPSTASAVSPRVGRARTTATSRTRAPTTGMAAPTSGAQSSGTNRATVHRTSSATSDRGQGEPGPADDAAEPQALAMGPSADRTAGASGRAGRRRPRAGRRGSTSGSRRAAVAGSGGATDPHQMAPGAVGERRRRRRQRRVGDTNWTESSRKTTDRISQVDDALRPEASADAAECARRRAAIEAQPVHDADRRLFARR